MKDPQIGNKKSSAPEIIGQAYEDLKELVKKYAASDQPVLFVGETGTGKELFAKLYMAESKRTGKKMTTNCAAESDALLRSEIFGHVRGAFTGADRERKGKISECDKGILFLDEIGDASPSFQAAILRVSEGNSFTPLGSDKEITGVNTLIIAATCRPQNIREDLKMRFQVLPVPPLQTYDIPVLAKHFLKGQAPSKEIIDELVGRKYPGNVRELKKTCEKLLTERGDRIFIGAQPKSYPAGSFDYGRYRMEMETWDQFIQRILVEHRFDSYIKYQYQDWDDKWMEPNQCNKKMEGLPIHKGINDYVRLPLNEFAVLLTDGKFPSSITEEDSRYLAMEFKYSMLTLIGWLLEGYHKEKEVPVVSYLEEDYLAPEELLPQFQKNLRLNINNGTLPYLLQRLNIDMNKKKESIQMPKPNLSDLFDLPLIAAEKKFIKKYGDYQLNRYPKDPGFMQAVGIKRKSMKQKINKI